MKNYEEKDRELFMEGEELAKIAVRSKMALDQLRKIYQMIRERQLIKTWPLEFVRAHIKRQMTRVSGRRGFNRILELMDKYKKDRKSLEQILAYSILLYDFYRNKHILDLIEAAEPAIRETLRKHGLSLYDLWPKHVRGNFVEIAVIIDKYPSDLGRLIMEIRNAFRKTGKISRLNLKIRIES